MTYEWSSQPLPMEFRLGEVHLFSIRLAVLQPGVHFAAIKADSPEACLPEGRPAQDSAIISFPVRRTLPRLRLMRGYLRYVPGHYPRYFMELQGDFECYLRTFSAKSRATLQRKVRKFAQFSGGEICWREFRRPEEMAEFYRLARSVSGKTYQERLLKAGLPDTAEFCAELQRLAAQDSVRGYLLFHEARPIAYLYCEARGDILLYRHPGYDPDFAPWSPGTVLQYLVTQRLHTEQRFRMLDFTEGEGAHKALFATGSLQCADVYFLRLTVRNMALVALHNSLAAVARSLAGLLKTLGLKARVKQWMRRGSRVAEDKRDEQARES